ncbi:hypothetical protein [Nocardia yunnanensis]|uniref:hypothetical protein n=1 Tax=Nocardia yunnanensis TaxID=2382165 RepID=UPI0013C4C73E|nr:hypothetical protein [Nocardia yunnanensis]
MTHHADVGAPVVHDTAAATPLHRIAEVNDIAAAFVFFLTKPHATATILPLDGGALLA